MEKELKNMSNWVKFILVNFPKWEAGEPTSLYFSKWKKN
jgi:hypothetical protein